MKRVRKGFYVGAFLAGGLGHCIIWAITTALTIAYPEKRAIFQMLMMPASWLAILSAVVSFILIYKMWAAIQGMGARTSAGKALGFMFIPLFNLYWAFQVYWGWTKDYNRIAERDDVELPRMPEGIGLTVCVLPLLNICLVVASIIVGGWESIRAGGAHNVGVQASMFVALINIILMAVLFSKICDGINGLADAGLEPQKPEYAVPREEAKISGSAIASLVLGICGFFTCGLAALVGLILGIVGLHSISKSGGRLKGQGLAIAGIAVSAVSMVLVPLTVMMTAILAPALSKARSQAKTAVALNNAKQLCLALQMYCDDHKGHLPPGDRWPEALQPYIGQSKTILTSPFEPGGGRAWAINPNLSMLNIPRGAKIVLFFEARPGSPPAGGPELLPERPRGRTGYVIGFVDGHVESVRPERLDELRWEP
jgi:hypothetical protein